MRKDYWLDIIFCILVLPGMMFLFPAGEWAQWHPGYVLTYAGWLYAVYFLCRRVLGPYLLQGWKGLLTAAGALFLMGAVTFLMTLTQVDFSQGAEGMEPHVRAMWVLLLGVVSVGLPTGMLSSKVHLLQTQKEEQQELDNALAALESRRTEAMGGPEQEIQLKAGYKTIHVPLSAVQYIESRNNYVCVHLDHLEDVISQLPLKNLLEMLPPGQFVRIHRSYAVPQWRIVKRTAAEVQLLGVKDPLPVGRAYKENLGNG